MTEYIGKDERTLRAMLDESLDFEERRKIRTAMREMRNKRFSTVTVTMATVPMTPSPTQTVTSQMPQKSRVMASAQPAPVMPTPKPRPVEIGKEKKSNALVAHAPVVERVSPLFRSQSHRIIRVPEQDAKIDNKAAARSFLNFQLCRSAISINGDDSNPDNGINGSVGNISDSKSTTSLATGISNEADCEKSLQSNQSIRLTSSKSSLPPKGTSSNSHPPQYPRKTPSSYTESSLTDRAEPAPVNAGEAVATAKQKTVKRRGVTSKPVGRSQSVKLLASKFESSHTGPPPLVNTNIGSNDTAGSRNTSVKVGRASSLRMLSRKEDHHCSTFEKTLPASDMGKNQIGSESDITRSENNLALLAMTQSHAQKSSKPPASEQFYPSINSSSSSSIDSPESENKSFTSKVEMRTAPGRMNSGVIKSASDANIRPAFESMNGVTYTSKVTLNGDSRKAPNGLPNRFNPQKAKLMRNEGFHPVMKSASFSSFGKLVAVELNEPIMTQSRAQVTAMRDQNGRPQFSFSDSFESNQSKGNSELSLSQENLTKAVEVNPKRHEVVLLRHKPETSPLVTSEKSVQLQQPKRPQSAGEMLTSASGPELLTSLQKYEAISDEKDLQKMLNDCTELEDRIQIRAALRKLKQKQLMNGNVSASTGNDSGLSNHDTQTSNQTSSLTTSHTSPGSPPINTANTTLEQNKRHLQDLFNQNMTSLESNENDQTSCAQDLKMTEKNKMAPGSDVDVDYSALTDEKQLQNLLNETEDYFERKKIRTALTALKRRNSLADSSDEEETAFENQKRRNLLRRSTSQGGIVDCFDSGVGAPVTNQLNAKILFHHDNKTADLSTSTLSDDVFKTTGELINNSDLFDIQNGHQVTDEQVSSAHILSPTIARGEGKVFDASLTQNKQGSLAVNEPAAVEINALNNISTQNSMTSLKTGNSSVIDPVSKDQTSNAVNEHKGVKSNQKDDLVVGINSGCMREDSDIDRKSETKTDLTFRDNERVSHQKATVQQQNIQETDSNTIYIKDPSKSPSDLDQIHSHSTREQYEKVTTSEHIKTNDSVSNVKKQANSLLGVSTDPSHAVSVSNIPSSSTSAENTTSSSSDTAPITRTAAVCNQHPNKHDVENKQSVSQLDTVRNINVNSDDNNHMIKQHNNGGILGAEIDGFIDGKTEVSLNKDPLQVNTVSGIVGHGVDGNKTDKHISHQSDLSNRDDNKSSSDNIKDTVITHFIPNKRNSGPFAEDELAQLLETHSDITSNIPESSAEIADMNRATEGALLRKQPGRRLPKTPQQQQKAYSTAQLTDNSHGLHSTRMDYQQSMIIPPNKTEKGDSRSTDRVRSKDINSNVKSICSDSDKSEYETTLDNQASTKKKKDLPTLAELNEEVKLLQQELESSQDFDERRGIRRDIRDLRTAIKDGRYRDDEIETSPKPVITQRNPKSATKLHIDSNQNEESEIISPGEVQIVQPLHLQTVQQLQTVTTETVVVDEVHKHSNAKTQKGLKKKQDRNGNIDTTVKKEKSSKTNTSNVVSDKTPKSKSDLDNGKSKSSKSEDSALLLDLSEIKPADDTTCDVIGRNAFDDGFLVEPEIESKFQDGVDGDVTNDILQTASTPRDVLAKEDLTLKVCENDDKQVKTDDKSGPEEDFEIMEHLTDAIGVDGETVKLRCKISKCSKATIKWFQGARELPPSTEFAQKFTGGQNIEMTILQVFPDDEGEFSCHIQHGDTLLISKCYLLVKENKAAILPKFARGLQDTTVDAGSKLVLSCEVSSVPAPRIYWYFSSIMIKKSNPELRQAYDGRLATLTIDKVLLEDNGEYTCAAKNAAGEVRCSCALIVTGPDDEADKTLEANEAQVEPESTSKQLNQAPAEPSQKDLPTKDKIDGNFIGKMKKESKKTETKAPIAHEESEAISDEDEWVVLETVEIETPIIAQSATNSSAKQTKIESHIVTMKTPEIKDAKEEIGQTQEEKRQPEAAEEPEEEEEESPEVEMVKDEFLLSEGDSLTLTCHVTGKPMPRVTWRKDDEDLGKSTDIRQEYENGVASLTISRVASKHAGTYECAAQSYAGSAGSTASVSVKAKPKPKVIANSEPIELPKITKPLPDLTEITMDNYFCLQCHFLSHSNKTQVAWFKDGIELPRVGRMKWTYERAYTKLWIHRASRGDVGHFKVVITNTAGSTQCATSVKFKEKEPEIPVRKKLQPKQVDEKASHLLSNVLDNIIATEATGSTSERGPLKKIYSHYKPVTTTSQEPVQKARPIIMTDKDVDKVDDEELLYKMLNETEDFDQRKKIRARLREIREQKTAEYEAKRKQREAEREDVVKLKQRQAKQDKERKLKEYQEQAKHHTNGSTDAVKEKHKKAEEEKQKRLATYNELAKTSSQAYQSGADITARLDAKKAQEIKDKENIRMSHPKTNEDSVTKSTKTEQGKDGSSSTTSTTTTKHTSKEGTTTVTKQTKTVTHVSKTGGTSYSINKSSAAKSGPRGAMAAFQQMDNDSPKPKTGRVTIQRSPSSVKQIMLDWCAKQVEDYETVNITNFSSCWNDGMAFCALIHHFHPEAFDFNKLDPKKRRANFSLAFHVAEKYADIAPLLDVDDMVRMKNPDWKCVFTYVQSFYRKFNQPPPNKS